MDDFIDSLAKFRIAFKRLNIDAPSVILLKSHRDGEILLATIRQTEQLVFTIGNLYDLGKPIEMSDGSVWMEIQLLDIKFRWPANKIATLDGSWAFV